MRDEFRKSDDTSRRGVTARDRFGRVLITHDNDASLPSSSFQLVVIPYISTDIVPRREYTSHQKWCKFVVATKARDFQGISFNSSFKEVNAASESNHRHSVEMTRQGERNSFKKIIT